MAWSILGDEDLLPERQWQPPPFKRGTNQILVECFVTLLLCVWTAVHLNLQPKWKHDEKGFRKFTSRIPWKKCGYLVLGMIAPELVTVVAIYQWRKTNDLWTQIQETELVGPKRPKEGKLKRLWRWVTCSRRSAPGQEEEIEMGQKDRPALIQIPTLPSAQESREGGIDGLAQADSAPCDEDRQQDGTSSGTTADQPNGSSATQDDQTRRNNNTKEQRKRRQHYWTKTHCWYAAIGGFVIQDLDGKPFPLPNGLTRMSLNDNAILHFAQNHPQTIPDISELAIEDKSKADILAKIIVCGQALWFCANLLGRVISSLPLTALELNTSAHCICTLLTYAFWWNKPYNVSDGTALILDDETASEAASLCLQSWDGTHVICEGSNLRHLPQNLSWISAVAGSQYIDLKPLIWSRTNAGLVLIGVETLLENLQDPRHLILNSYLTIFRGSLRCWFYSNFPFTDWLKDGWADRQGKLRVPYAREHRELINLALKFDHDNHPCKQDPRDKRWKRIANRSTPEFSWRVYLQEDDEASFLWDDFSFSGMILLACVLYGGIHLLAFNGPFPSTVDMVGWYCGALAFVPYCLWLVLGYSLFAVQTYVASGSLSKKRFDWCWIVFSLLGILAPVLFILFRGFLTYEPYAALGFAPAGAYEVPNWSAYFIHIS